MSLTRPFWYQPFSIRSSMIIRASIHQRLLNNQIIAFILIIIIRYIFDWVARCKWPSSIRGNWGGLPELQGRLRLCTRSLFFEPDDVRVPIVR